MAIVFKDLHKLVSSHSQQENTRKELFVRLQGKPFWIWNIEEHKQEDIKTNGDCCFNHIIGLPQKDGNDKPLYDYEEIIFDSLVTQSGNANKHVRIKKATSEFMLRFMTWLCWQLLTNATVVDDAIRFVSDKKKEELKLFTNS